LRKAVSGIAKCFSFSRTSPWHGRTGTGSILSTSLRQPSFSSLSTRRGIFGHTHRRPGGRYSRLRRWVAGTSCDGRHGPLDVFALVVSATHSSRRFATECAAGHFLTHYIRASWIVRLGHVGPRCLRGGTRSP